MDIFWNILCHVYGEDKLLESMRVRNNHNLEYNNGLGLLLYRIKIFTVFNLATQPKTDKVTWFNSSRISVL